MSFVYHVYRVIVGQFPLEPILERDVSYTKNIDEITLRIPTCIILFLIYSSNKLRYKNLFYFPKLIFLPILNPN